MIKSSSNWLIPFSRICLLLFLSCSASLITAQTAKRQKQLDSLTLKFTQDSIDIFGFKKIRPYFNYQERNSIKNPKIINFSGPQIGVMLFERHITGFSFYFSSNNTKKPFETEDNNLPVSKSINIKYLTFFYQYILIKKRYYEVHLPVEVGRGILHAGYKNQEGHLYKTTDAYFTLGGFGGQLILKPIKWLGISGIYGYRIASENIISGFYYAFGVWIGFKPLITEIHYIIKRKKYRDELVKVLTSKN